MNKKEFLKLYAKNTNIPISQIDAVLTEITNCFTKALLKTCSKKKRIVRKDPACSNKQLMRN